MTDASRILIAAEQGNPQAASELLPLVYDELRRLAAQRLSMEKAGQTIDATSLVHEAYLRLIGGNADRAWTGRRHFCAAAAEAMRRILIDRARRKQRIRHGGAHTRLPLDDAQPVDDAPDDRLLALDEALARLASEEPEVVEVVKLRYYAGLTIAQTAEALEISVRTANRHWSFARAWLYQQLS